MGDRALIKRKLELFFRQLGDVEVRQLMSVGGYVGFKSAEFLPVLSFGLDLGMMAVGHWVAAVPISAIHKDRSRPVSSEPNAQSEDLTKAHAGGFNKISDYTGKKVADCKQQVLLSRARRP